MRWVAIIRVRCSTGAIPAAIGAMRELTRSLPGPKPIGSSLVSAAIYRHSTIETDVAMALHFEESTVSSDATALVTLMTTALQDFGLVEEAAWIEEPPIDPTQQSDQ